MKSNQAPETCLLVDKQEPTHEVERLLKAFETTLSSLGDGLIITDGKGAVVSMNAVAEELTGFPDGGAAGHPLSTVLPLSDEEGRPWNPVKAALYGEQTTTRATHLMGDRVLVHTASPLYDEAGSLTGALLLLRDHTQEAEQASALLKRQARPARERDALISLATTTSPGEDLLTRVRTITATTAQAMDVARVSIWRFSSSRTAIECLTLYDSVQGVHSSIPQIEEKHYPRYFQALKSIDMIVANDAHKDPRTREFTESYLKPLGISSMIDAPTHLNGQVDGVICCEHLGPARDWTEDEKTFVLAVANMVSLALEGWERRRVEDALRESTHHYQAIVNSLPVAVCRWRPDYVITYANQEYSRLFAGGADVVGERWIDRVSPARRPQVEQAVQAALLSPRTVCYESESVLIDGKSHSFTWVDVPICDELGQLMEFQSAGMDMTDRTERDEQLRQVQKMESIGRLAGGVAHDFNNMLGIILGHTDLMLDEVDRDSPLSGDLTEIKKAAQRSAELTRQLLAFARKQIIAPKVLDLNVAIPQMLSMLRPLLGEGVDLSWRPSTDPQPVRIDPGQLDQVLANLALNARDAMAGQGKLIIETSHFELTSANDPRLVGALPGPYTVLSVSDDGDGMDEETVANAFEPFYTTKKLGESSGLGLATVYGIVQQNQGFVSIESIPGDGARVQVCLPRQGADESIALPGSAASGNPGGDETVLLIEDEQALLQLNKRLLERLGYHVLAAVRPEQAIALSRGHAGTIHLMLSDVIMPGMNGFEVWDVLHQERPHMACLFVSGYPDSEIAQHGLLQDGCHYLAKPFSSAALALKMREILDPLNPVGRT